MGDSIINLLKYDTNADSTTPLGNFSVYKFSCWLQHTKKHSLMKYFGTTLNMV